MSQGIAGIIHFRKYSDSNGNPGKPSIASSSVSQSYPRFLKAEFFQWTTNLFRRPFLIDFLNKIHTINITCFDPQKLHIRKILMGRSFGIACLGDWWKYCAILI